LPKSLKAREVIERLRAYDRRFVVNTSRGKGSHVMLEHPDINGHHASIPMTNHKGKDVHVSVLKSIQRRFNLPSDIFS
jgi:predicted RNA binding protein YcfA (HicA-like mRNA interferase family)